MEYKLCTFELGGVNGEGTFTGYANVYEIEDLGKDVVHRGAARDSIQAKGGRVPLLDSHEPSKRLGVVYVDEDDHGLKVSKGVLNLEKQAGRDAFADLQFAAQHDIPLQMSIGFEITSQRWEKDTRHIDGLNLWEVSLVTFGMNPESRVESVKDAKETERIWGRLGDLESKVKALEAKVQATETPSEPGEGAVADGEPAGDSLGAKALAELDATLAHINRTTKTEK